MHFKSVNKIFNLQNKVIILTGSAGLLGTEYANILSDAGATLILVDTNTTKNIELKNKINKQYKSNSIAMNVDITSKNDVQKMVLDVVSKYGKIDGLINNAFLNHAKNQSQNGKNSFESFPIEIWNKSLDLNLTAVFICCQEVGKVMVKQKNGVIVNISSIYGISGADQRIYGKSNLNSPVSYAASKGGIVNLTRYLAAYWNKKNIRVNTLTLGGVQDNSYQTKEFINKYSEKTILGRMAKKEDYKGAILFLMSDASSYMTGSNLIIDGGWTAW
ncbi:MAG: SDR family NAD(P)-dependent oxidoreductase [Crenarchaeota archaeon]|nr:MAG: SDR family NAD(P)-dependent oxidoreductase [Thermoproteota archaeon]RDJ33313.1 MAG: SDR family NAD(P)-dependent oxidoreductase [Thermoproteota archaeon]RDJ36184.1 MAG: SDR family NAD(P)-dependent oxidoreductase [Thermoproteota archaeon]RDJ38815.1 MAG: SDR family NAD(P)-dependent oxidoreductase [Thermoproteota archaeon]